MRRNVPFIRRTLFLPLPDSKNFLRFPNLTKARRRRSRGAEKKVVNNGSGKENEQIIGGGVSVTSCGWSNLRLFSARASCSPMPARLEVANTLHLFFCVPFFHLPKLAHPQHGSKLRCLIFYVNTNSPFFLRMKFLAKFSRADEKGKQRNEIRETCWSELA